MDNLHCLDYPDGQPSLPASPGWTTCTPCITRMDNLHSLHHLDRQPSLLGLPSLPDDLDGQRSLTLIY
eukprot:4220518-Karenia_brevis.AAC.1